MQDVKHQTRWSLSIGDVLPDFDLQTSQGSMSLHAYFGSKWGLLVSHPDDFTPVCTTEMGELARLEEDNAFKQRNVKVIGLSCNDVSSHEKWIKDIQCYAKCPVSYPIIADASREVAQSLGMLSLEEKDAEGLPLTVRSVFLVNPKKEIQFMATYPACTGRNMQELLRVVDALQLTSRSKAMLATPVNWTPGKKVCLLPSVTEDMAKTQFPSGSVRVVELPSGKPYLRMTDDNMPMMA